MKIKEIFKILKHFYLFYKLKKKIEYFLQNFEKIKKYFSKIEKN